MGCCGACWNCAWHEIWHEEKQKDWMLWSGPSKRNVYVPFLETLKCMCRNVDVCTLLTEFTGRQKSHIEDFCDGSYFQSHPLFSKHPSALQIQVYYDEFETANPLGSKRGIHKVGVFYFVLRNLPPKFVQIYCRQTFHRTFFRTSSRV